MKLMAPPGVFDIIPNEPQELWRSSYLWQYVEAIAREVAKQFGFQEIRTPIFERTELFQRGVGETTDIVSKEMYTFEDRGNRSLSLRPEGTAPVMRALIEHGILNQQPQQRLFYIGPMFRYERAQAGRYRQHHQFGVESIGSNEPEYDAELITLLYTFYSRLGLQQLDIHVNNLGDTAARQRYRQALIEYFSKYKENLSEDSLVRLERNPLRILDSKAPQDQALVADAPALLDYLSEESKAHFERVQQLLAQLDVPFRVNQRLVRGLDYYNQTVFEIVSGSLGAQNSVGGGGRFDGLIHQLGGPNIPSAGFGTGLERVIQTMINQKIELPKPYAPHLLLVPLGEAAKTFAFGLQHRLRQAGLHVQTEFSQRKLQKVLQLSNQLSIPFVAIIGDEELQAGEVTLKEMQTNQQQRISSADLAAYIQKHPSMAIFKRSLKWH